ncbi:FtsK/SpoIIIE domain-containing protein [Catenulispora pinisilvae]|uniref:FtsK/SpoIIIE domain-containing protein n=1 Tax=Catenulispora pinisilvae TaxID=2705253 RepID=UPI001891A44F|nr:FtsK/SpoIIIE domain-containing protein [Catenulispora pinisilvae]
MRMLITVARPAGRSHDVVVDADPTTPVRDVVKGLLDVVGADAAADAAEAVFLDGVRVDLSGPLGTAGIHDGAVLWLGAPGEAGEPGRPAASGSGLVTIRAVAGVDSGRVWHLGAGVHQIGSDPSCAVRLGSGQPGVVATVRVSLDASVRIRPVFLREPPELDRVPLADAETETDWPETVQVRIGESRYEQGAVRQPDAMIEVSPEGEWLDYNRPPRLLPPEARNAFRLPAEPPPARQSPLPWITALMPVGLGVVMTAILHNTSYLLMAGFSPVMMVGNWLNGRRTGKVGHRRMQAEFVEQLASAEQEVDRAMDLERLRLRSWSPDAAELLLIATGPRSRLWERRRSDPDHLLVRVGLADLDSSVVVEQVDGAQRTSQHRTAHDAPAAFSIAQAGVVGVAGRGEWPRRMARWLVGQIAVLQSPRDLQLYVLTDPAGDSLWDWATWLPHARPSLGQRALTLVGADAETLGHRVAELGDLIAARQRARLDSGSGAGRVDPDLVVVLDGALRLRALPGVVTVLREGPAVGVYSICVDADERTLPEECTTILAGGIPGQPVSLRQQRAARIDAILADDVSAEWYPVVGRRLAPLRDVSEVAGGMALPDAARLLDLLDLADPSPAVLSGRWHAAGRSTKAVIGASLDGPFALDLVAHGPHGLVAGTTGSGKSEFLQSLVASLAVANRPDAMTFVLVDYKGGAAFKDCVDLPHTVGMVTDLDTHLVERALTSLGAELTHRERLLAAAGAKDLEDYLDYATRRPDLAPIPRLLIVIDEFASMVRELPDFVTGLVNVAQRGRSLGIHLILATQRPSGVVSAEIRANTNLRVALRVTDAAESTDVIDARDAANISPTHPGRGYARLGHSSLLPFQTGRVGGRRPSKDRSVSAPAPFLRPVDWLDLGRPAPERPAAVTETDVVPDLSVLVSALRQTTDLLGLPEQRRPWLPPLPTAPVVELATEPTPAESGEPVFSWAIQDLPAAQAQEPVAIDLATFGHFHIIGAPRSGRSQTLRTIAAAAASAASVPDLHLYGLDCGNGALLPLSKFPHCGAIVQRSETERASRLLKRLHAEVMNRQRILGEGGFADLTEQRRAGAPEERLPHIMLLLDRWEGFMGTLSEHDNGSLTEIIHTLMREGASVGVHVVIAGDRTLMSGRISSLTEDKLVLRLPDKSDYSLVGLNPRTIPENMAPGRGYRSMGATETQVALVAADPSGPAQVAALRALASRLTDREADVPKNQRPGRIAVLPAQLTFQEAWGYLEEERKQPWALLGVGGDELEPVGATLFGDRPTFLIAGPSGSGRSTALGVMAESLLRTGAEIVIGAPSATPLSALVGRPGVRGLVNASDPVEEELSALLDPGEGPVVLIIDDGEAWRECRAREWLRAYVRSGSGRNRGLILGGEIGSVAMGFSGWQAEVKKNRRGALLSPPELSNGDLVGIRLARSQLAPRVVPGACLVHLGDGVLTTAQIPTMSPNQNRNQNPNKES